MDRCSRGYRVGTMAAPPAIARWLAGHYSDCWNRAQNASSARRALAWSCACLALDAWCGLILHLGSTRSF